MHFRPLSIQAISWLNKEKKNNMEQDQDLGVCLRVTAVFHLLSPTQDSTLGFK